MSARTEAISAPSMWGVTVSPWSATRLQPHGFEAVEQGPYLQATQSPRSRP